MTTTFYKSLDKPLDIIGLKGNWISIFLYCCGGAVVLGLVLGGVAGSFGFGFIVVVVAIVLSFFICTTLQLKTSDRQVVKGKVASKVESWVIRRESLSRILLEEPMYDEVKRLMRTRESNASQLPEKSEAQIVTVDDDSGIPE